MGLATRRPESAAAGSARLRRRTLWRVAVAALAAAVPSSAQQAIEVSAAGIPLGVNLVAPGGEILLYAVELQDAVPDVRTARIGGVPLVSEGITFTISDLTAPTGVLAADFTALNLYLSADGVLDGGDTFLKATAAVIGAPMLIDFTGVPGPDRVIPDAPATSFWLIAADIAPGATIGHAFRFGAAGLHIDVRDTGGGPATDYTVGSAIGAADANQVLISLTAGGGGGAAPSAGGAAEELVSVPFHSGWLLGLLIAAYAVYTLVRRQP